MVYGKGNKAPAEPQSTRDSSNVAGKVVGSSGVNKLNQVRRRNVGGKGNQRVSNTHTQEGRAR